MKVAKKNIILTAMCGLLGLSVAKAQENRPEILRADLETAIRIALSENPSVKVADMEIRKREHARKGAYGALFPQIDVIGQYQRTLKRQTMYMDAEMTGSPVDLSKFTPEELKVMEVLGKIMPSADAGKGIRMGRRNLWNGTVNVNLPLVVPSLWKNIRMSRVDLEMAMEQSRSSKIDLTHQVKKAFYSVLLAKDSYDLFRETYTTDSLNLVNIRNKFTQGVAAEYDVITADVRLKSIIPNILQSESMVKIAELQLKMLMGIDSDTPVEIAGSLSDYEAGMFETIVPGDDALWANSDLKQFDLQTLQAENAHKISKLRNLPSLTSSFSYSLISQNNHFRIGHYRWDPYSVAGVTLSVPIFSGGQRYHDIKQSGIRLLQLQEQRRDLMRNLQLSVRNSTELINKSIEQVVAAASSVQQAKKGYEITQKRYETGAGTIVDLNTAALSVTGSELQYRNAIYDYLAAKADLEKTLGYDVDTVNRVQ
ncbi:MAG: TolC family protein [Proteiniphilum sp.]|jgi:outer membrane protein TolC|nr:TolC family protein [Proteiniphilum sp.]